MEADDIRKQVTIWGEAKPTSDYLAWARHYYTNLYTWHRWWVMAQLTPSQREVVWKVENNMERACTPAELCLKYGLKCDVDLLDHAPSWRFRIGQEIGKMDNFNQELSDFENFALIDRLLLSKSI